MILSISPETANQIALYSKVCPSLIDRIEKLENNPHSVAKKTNDKKLTDYYVSAGRYDLLFNINDDVVEVEDVVRGPYLHKILMGRTQYAKKRLRK